MGSPWTVSPDTSGGGSVIPYVVPFAPVPVYKGERLELDYSYYSADTNHHNNSAFYHNNNFTEILPHNNHQPHFPYQNKSSNNNNNNKQMLRKRSYVRLDILPPEPAKRLKEPYAMTLREIPTWNIYFNDQKHRLVDFKDGGNQIKPDYYLNKLVSLCFDDVCITKLAVDAVVTSTTKDYAGNSGVDRKIHEEAGRGLQEASKKLPLIEVGGAQITHGFLLPARHIIHTNGPFPDNPEKLKNCYENSLNLLLQYHLRTIAFPCISTGKKGCSRKMSCITALSTVRNFLERNRHNKIDRIIFCLYNPQDICIYRRFMQLYFPVADE